MPRDSFGFLLISNMSIMILISSMAIRSFWLMGFSQLFH